MVQEIETVLGRQAVEQRRNADLSDEARARVGCSCGSEARYAGRRAKQVESVLGPLRLERAYYHCSACGHGYCPGDKHLGIENTSLSPALTRMLGTQALAIKDYLGSGSSLCRTAMLLATAKLGKDERKHFNKSLQLSDSLEKLCVTASI